MLVVAAAQRPEAQVRRTLLAAMPWPRWQCRKRRKTARWL
jgi:hypothetical protein